MPRLITTNNAPAGPNLDSQNLYPSLQIHTNLTEKAKVLPAEEQNPMTRQLLSSQQLAEIQEQSLPMCYRLQKKAIVSHDSLLHMHAKLDQLCIAFVLSPVVNPVTDPAKTAMLLKRIAELKERLPMSNLQWFDS